MRAAAVFAGGDRVSEWHTEILASLADPLNGTYGLGGTAGSECGGYCDPWRVNMRVVVRVG